MSWLADLFTKFKWKYHIWRYDLPSREHVLAGQIEYVLQFDWIIKQPGYEMCELYLAGKDIEEIANIYCVTRTRVRAILFKFARKALK